MNVVQRTCPLVFAASALLLACGGDDTGSGTFDNSSGTGSGGATGSGGSSLKDASSGTGGNLFMSPDVGTGGPLILEDGEVCAGEMAMVQTIPFDMFIMLDQSLSMNDPLVKGMPTTRWQAVSKAITDFVSSPSVSQLGVGIGYFGLPKVGSPGVTSCDIADYAKPAVEIGPLSDPATVTALTQSVGMHMPSSTTPTAPALGGALQHAKQWAMAHPDRPTIVVFATDGVPSDCEPLAQDTISAMYVKPAAEMDPKVRTFVIGAGSGGSLSALRRFAQDGGTVAPVIVEDSPDTAKKVTDALLKISHTNISCTYDLALPDGGIVDPHRVNVLLSETGKTPRWLDYIEPPKMCGASGGFFYDNSLTPKKVYLCESTCQSLFDGSIQVNVGCPTQGITN
jgi:hypothetical protein